MEKKRWLTGDSVALWQPGQPWQPDVRQAEARAKLEARPPLRTRRARRIFRYRLLTSADLR